MTDCFCGQRKRKAALLSCVVLWLGIYVSGCFCGEFPNVPLSGCPNDPVCLGFPCTCPACEVSHELISALFKFPIEWNTCSVWTWNQGDLSGVSHTLTQHHLSSDWLMMWAWALLPVFMALWGIMGFWAVFAMAVSNHSVNVTAHFPYISLCGSYPPQSSVFSQICNGCTLLAIWIGVIRYQQVRDLGDKCRHANLVSLVVELVSAAAVSVLGNFQVSVWYWVHMVAAGLAFSLGLVYFWLQLWLTLKAEPSQVGHWVAPLRTVLCSLSTAFLIGIALLHISGFRSLAAMSEWALVMTYFLFFGLFAVEFRHIDYFRITVQKHTRQDRKFSKLIMP